MTCKENKEGSGQIILSRSFFCCGIAFLNFWNPNGHELKI